MNRPTGPYAGLGRLRLRWQALGLTDGQFARALGRHPAAFSRLVSGRDPISFLTGELVRATLAALEAAAACNVGKAAPTLPRKERRTARALPARLVPGGRPCAARRGGGPRP